MSEQNKTHYYISDPTAPRGFIELTESEWYAIVGTEETRPYVNKVYRGELSIEEVPTELQEAVSVVVAAKVERFGLYSERELPANEALNIIAGGEA